MTPVRTEELAHALFDLLAEALKGGQTEVSASDIYQRALAMAQGSRA